MGGEHAMAAFRGHGRVNVSNPPPIYTRGWNSFQPEPTTPQYKNTWKFIIIITTLRSLMKNSGAAFVGVCLDGFFHGCCVVLDVYWSKVEGKCLIWTGSRTPWFIRHGIRLPLKGGSLLAHASRAYLDTSA